MARPQKPKRTKITDIAKSAPIHQLATGVALGIIIWGLKRVWIVACRVGGNVAPNKHVLLEIVH